MRLLPLIEVTVEPGESSDISKLEFSYKIAFVDSRTIEVVLLWGNAPFVSANQPEDVLVIRFNGPIFDK